MVAPKRENFTRFLARSSHFGYSRRQQRAWWKSCQGIPLLFFAVSGAFLAQIPFIRQRSGSGLVCEEYETGISTKRNTSHFI
jgi:hypothetical protein